MSRLFRIAAVVVVIGALAGGSAAANNGRGGGHGASAPASCSMSGNVVYGVGLPTGEVINFMITDSSGTWGFVLGYTSDGAWSVNVPAPTGPTTYEFVSRTFGNGGSKYKVFASCAA